MKEDNKVKKDNGNKETNKNVDCKIRIKGKDKTLKTHKLMTNGITGLESIMKQSTDEGKKENLFKDWMELHKQMDKIMITIEGMDKNVNNGYCT